MVEVEEVVAEVAAVADLVAEEEVVALVVVAPVEAVVEVEVVDVAAVLFETEKTKMQTRRPDGRKVPTDRQMTRKHTHVEGAEEASQKGKLNCLLTKTNEKRFSVAFKSENRSGSSVPRRILSDRSRRRPPKSEKGGMRSFGRL